MNDDLILAATSWKSNADLIADVARLGYIKADDEICDLTYGRGTWWKKCTLGVLTTNDWDTETQTDRHWDFREVGWVDEVFDVVAFDPPYVCVGGRKTTTIQAHHDRYGMGDTPTTPRALQDMIDGGIDEADRICKPGGIILIKCANYISSGKMQPGVFWTQQHTRLWSWTLEEQLVMVGKPGRQSQKRQVHARNNWSCLLILRKPRR